MRKPTVIKFVALALYAGLLATVGLIGAARSQSAPDFGEPLPGLTANQLVLFRAGKRVFESNRRIEDGLGPVFNDFGCAQCHAQPETGGTEAVTEINFGRMVNGVFDPMVEFGGPVQQVTGIIISQPVICRVAGERVPSEANVVAFRQSQPLFGLGLIENIPESAIISRADPQDLDGDGISGRPNMVKDSITNRVGLGRLGWKAQIPSILAFSATALINELGITTTVFPDELNPQGEQVICDTVADPEDKDADGDGMSDGMVAIANFISFLGPPPRGPVDESVRAGESIFARVGCNKCHVPTFLTGDSTVAALNRKPVNLYSDLLLHDMGPLGDGIWDNVARGTEMRTAPLWGLRASVKYLHDGRAATVEGAILFHAGEAEDSRDRFLALAPAEKVALLAFLNSL